MKLSKGIGEINVGSNNVKKIAAPAPMALEQLSSGATGRHALIAVRQDKNDARIEVTGRAKVTINHQAIATTRPWPARLATTETILFLIAGAATVAGAKRTHGTYLPSSARRHG